MTIQPFGLTMASSNRPSELAENTPTPTTFRWARVTQSDPLRILLDGTSEELPVTPDSLLDTDSLSVGSRVWVQLFGLRMIVIGFAGGTSKPSIEGWHDMELENGWVPYSAVGTGYQQAQYTLRSGIVHLHGLVKDGVTALNTVVANLPVGYRPARTLLVATWSGSNAARIDIRDDGDIVVVTDVVSSWLSLDNISFPAEQ